MSGDFAFAFDNEDFADRKLLIFLQREEAAAAPVDRPYRSVHVSSDVLARGSPSFHKLLSSANAMRESSSMDVRMVVNTAADSNALYAALKIMHHGTWIEPGGTGNGISTGGVAHS
jgi:hypothetical protein